MNSLLDTTDKEIIRAARQTGRDHLTPLLNNMEEPKTVEDYPVKDEPLLSGAELKKRAEAERQKVLNDRYEGKELNSLESIMGVNVFAIMVKPRDKRKGKNYRIINTVYRDAKGDCHVKPLCYPDKKDAKMRLELLKQSGDPDLSPVFTPEKCVFKIKHGWVEE